jgi:hypothetical protein
MDIPRSAEKEFWPKLKKKEFLSWHATKSNGNMPSIFQHFRKNTNARNDRHTISSLFVFRGKKIK